MSYEDEELARIQAETIRRKKELEALQLEELRRIQELERRKQMGVGEDYSPEADSAFIQNPLQNQYEQYAEQQYAQQQYAQQQAAQQAYEQQMYAQQVAAQQATQRAAAQQEQYVHEQQYVQNPMPRKHRKRTYDPDQAVSDTDYLESFDDDYDEYDDYDEAYEEYSEDTRGGRKSGRDSREKNSRDRGGRGRDDHHKSSNKGKKDNHRKEKPQKKKKNPVKKFFRNLIIIILILLLAFGGAVWNITRKFNKIDTEVSKRPDSMKHQIVNILLVGQDARDGQESQRSDSMIILSINQKTNNACMISLMRDTYVDIPGYGGNRLNAAYAYGGFDLLDQTIEQNFDITIDGNMMVDFNGFLDAMSAIGSLKMDLTAEEAQYMNENPALGSNNDVSDEEWSLTEGENELTPSQILCYSRMRYVGNSDWDRTERQRKVISGVVSQVKHGHFIKGYKVASQAAPSITTDLGTFGMMRLASGLVTSGEMQSYIIPAENTYYADTVDGMAVLVPDIAANQQLIQEYMNGTE